jgi:hypothetical protein
MGILNYRTRVAPQKTISELMQKLASKGAQSITAGYDSAGKQSRLSFAMKVGGIEVSFSLPVNVKGVAVALADGRQPTKTQLEHAEWVAWRILKDWVEAQIALIESGQAEMGQVFMPYAEAPDGRTMYELFVENNQRQLGKGK